MFFNTKRSPRKTTHQTLSTEQLEPKAMFSVSPVEPVVALDVGPVNQASYDCQGEGHFQLTHRVGSTSGPGGTSFMTGKDGRSIVHPNYNVGLDGYIATTEDANEASFNVGKDGRSIVHPNYNVGLDGYIATTEDANEASFNVGKDGRSIVHPNYNVGLNVLAQANQQPSLTAIRDVDVASESLAGSADPGGDDVFMPKPNREIVSGGKGNGYAEAVGLDSSIVSGGKGNGYAEAVGLNSSTVVSSSSDSYSEVEWTYFAARQEVFARMGR